MFQRIIFYRSDEVLYVSCKFGNDFLFVKELAIPQQELLFLKFEKFIIESLRYRKTTPRYFYTSLNLFISCTIQVNSRREAFLENSSSWKYLFTFLDAFFWAKFLKNVFYSNCTSIVCNFTKSWSASQTRF